MPNYIKFSKNGIDLRINLTTNELCEGIPNDEVMRYLKGVLTNKERFKGRFSHPLKKAIKEYALSEDTSFIDGLEKAYKGVTPYTYNEAFKISDDMFRSKVFGSINVNEMIINLGSKRIATEGKRVNHKKYDKNGNFLGYEEYDVIYEIHEVKGEKLGIEENVYALKCWCTSTNKEHSIWIEEKYKDSPLEAVASLVRIHENLIPNIKEIKRQGDMILVEMIDDTIEPKGVEVPLNAEQYFRLLSAQS